MTIRQLVLWWWNNLIPQNSTCLWEFEYEDGLFVTECCKTIIGAPTTEFTHCPFCGKLIKVFVFDNNLVQRFESDDH